MSVEYYDVRTWADVNDTVSLLHWWPPRQQVPQLLLDVAAATASLRSEPLRTTGFWGINGGHVSDFYVANGADLLEQFGMFMTSYDGDYAVWYHEGAAAGAEPVVHLKDSGAVCVLAASLREFFEVFSSGRGIGGLTTFDSAFLCGELSIEQIAQRFGDGAVISNCVKLAATSPPSRPAPKISDYFRTFSADMERANRADPTLRSIAALLKNHRNPASDDDPFLSLNIRAADETLTVSSSDGVPASETWLPELADLLPLLLSGRLERAKGPTKPFGPWSEARLRLYADGYVALRGMWDVRDRS
jgi:hypothetical protein